MHDESQWRQFREQVCLPTDSIYLNCGSFSPLPRCVLEELTRVRTQLATQPSDFFWRHTPKRLPISRKRLAEYLGAATDRLLLLPNVTFAINLAVRSLELPDSAEILVSNQEYGAMLYCWDELARRTACRVRVAELPLSPKHPDEIVDAVADQIGPQTRVLFFSHVTSPTGLVFPAEQLCRLADSRGLVSIVDGAHAPGMLPLNLEQINADFYGGNCHKWMMAPTGAGFLYVRAEHKPLLQPLITSWGWDRPTSEDIDTDSGWGSSFWARNLEFHGTQDRAAQIVLPTVLDFRNQIGETALIARSRELAKTARRLAEERGLKVITPAHEQLHGSLLAIELPPVHPLAARDWMWNTCRIEAPTTQAAGQCFLRLSTAWFNTAEEIEQAIDAVTRMPVAQLGEP